jgi:hypothetical protein
MPGGGFMPHCQCYVGGTRLQCTEAFSFFFSLYSNSLFQDLTHVRGSPKTDGGKENLSSGQKKVFWLGHSPVSPKGWRHNFLTCPEAPKAAKSQTPPAMSVANTSDLSCFLHGYHGPRMEVTSPVLQYCLWAGSTWTAVVTNNPSCIEPGNSLFPQP